MGGKDDKWHHCAWFRNPDDLGDTARKVWEFIVTTGLVSEKDAARMIDELYIQGFNAGADCVNESMRG
jgi:hypothetical protein